MGSVSKATKCVQDGKFLKGLRDKRVRRGGSRAIVRWRGLQSACRVILIRHRLVVQVLFIIGETELAKRKATVLPRSPNSYMAWFEKLNVATKRFREVSRL